MVAELFLCFPWGKTDYEQQMFCVVPLHASLFHEEQ